MVANYKRTGQTVNYINTSDATIAAGTIVALAARIAVAAGDIKPGEVGALATEGVFAIPKATTLAIGQGDLVYFNAKTGATKTDTDVPAGWAVAAAAAADTEVQVKLLG